MALHDEKELGIKSQDTRGAFPKKAMFERCLKNELEFVRQAGSENSRVRGHHLPSYEGER